MLLKRLISLLLISFLLSSRIATQYVKGIIIAEEKIVTYAHKNYTKENIVSITGSGAVTGTSVLLLILAGGGNVVASESLALIGAATG